MVPSGISTEPYKSPRITVAFVLPHLKMGGIEHVVLRLANGLDRSRYRPILFLRRGEGELLQQLATDVLVLDAQGRRSILLAPFLARKFHQQKVDVVYSGTNAINLACIMALALMRRRARPRLMISEHSSADAYLAGAKAQKLRRAVVHALYPRADLLVTPLESIAQDWKHALGLGAMTHAVAPNPVLEAGWKSFSDGRIPRQAGLVVAAGRLIADKGFDLLIGAFGTVARSRKDARLKIYGEGPKRAWLQSLIDAQGLGETITMPGLTNKLMAEFASASAVAVPSRREGFGNVVVEAMAAGAPIVATDCAGPRVLLTGLAHAKIIGIDDQPGLAAALMAILSRPIDLAAQSAAQLRASQYGVEASVRVFAGLIEQVLSQPASLGIADHKAV